MADEHEYRIVVGFDGSEGSKRAVQWSAETLRSRRGRMSVVRAWSHGEFGSDEEQSQIAQKTLDDDVARVIGADPGFAVSTIARSGHAAKVLLDEAATADMLVVGSRGRGGFTGLLLGSVSQHVATHAGAPVVVIVRS